jgi:hypothetical protein
MAQYNMAYRMVKAKGANTAVFVHIEARDTVHVPQGNRDLVVSVTFYESADPSSRCMYALCFHIRSSSLEQACKSALQVVYYLAENCGIPPESVDLTYNGGGNISEDDGRADVGSATPAEIVILVPPPVFDGRPTPLMLVLNYELARQMIADGLQVDVDAYAQERQFVRLPNTFNSDAGRFVVAVRAEELLYMATKAVAGLSARPRPDDSYAMRRSVPEATEWFAEALRQAEKHTERQSRLREALLRSGWQVPPCIRRLDWADMSDAQALAACRIIARFYPFIHAREDEVWYRIRRLDQRHGIGDYPRLRNIVTFGRENPAFVGCEHPLLQRFCPAGKCFVVELISEYENPLLFT